MIKFLIFFYILFINAFCSQNTATNKYQDADVAWLLYKIYNGFDTLDIDSGFVFHRHQSKEHGAYAIWKQKNLGECFI